MRLDNCFSGVLVEASKGEVPYPTADEIVATIRRNGGYGVYHVEFIPKDAFCEISRRLDGVTVGILVHGRNSVSLEVTGNGKFSNAIKHTLARAMAEIGTDSASNAKKTVQYLLEECQSFIESCCFIVAKTYYREKVEPRMTIMPYNGGEIVCRSRSMPSKSKPCEISIAIDGVEQSDEQIVDIIGEDGVNRIASRATLVPVRDTLIKYNDKVVLYDGIACEMPPRGVLVAALIFERYNGTNRPITVDEIRNEIASIHTKMYPDGDIVVLSDKQVYTAINEINRALREASRSKSRFTKYIVNHGYGKGYTFNPKELKLVN